MDQAMGLETACWLYPFDFLWSALLMLMNRGWRFSLGILLED